MFGSPIAAGNLFTGSFELNFGDTGKSTHFGVPFHKTPLALVGYYKYKAGTKLLIRSRKRLRTEKTTSRFMPCCLKRATEWSIWMVITH